MLQVLGLARRAGRAAVGTRALKDASADGELHLVVLARDATDNAVARLRGAIERSGAARVRCGSRVELGAALGRGPVAAVGVTDPGLAKRIGGLAAGSPESRHGGRGPRQEPTRQAGDETTNAIHTS